MIHTVIEHCIALHCGSRNLITGAALSLSHGSGKGQPGISSRHLCRRFISIWIFKKKTLLLRTKWLLQKYFTSQFSCLCSIDDEQTRVSCLNPAHEILLSDLLHWSNIANYRVHHSAGHVAPPPASLSRLMMAPSFLSIRRQWRQTWQYFRPGSDPEP